MSTAGDNPVFYAAYVFFEKKRLKENKPKSAKRQEMEKIYAKNIRGELGFPREDHGDKKGYLCRDTERPMMDKYGKVHFLPKERFRRR